MKYVLFALLTVQLGVAITDDLLPVTLEGTSFVLWWFIGFAAAYEFAKVAQHIEKMNGGGM